MDFKTRLQKARRDAKLAQEAVGYAITSPEKPEGIGKQAISHWETGVNQPSASPPPSGFYVH